MADLVAPRRLPGIAALFALGVYLVLVLTRVIETLGYVVGGYTYDPLAYLAQMMPSAAPGWFLAPIPFALVAWLGLGLLFPIRADLRTSSVVGRALVTSLTGILVAGVVIAIGAFIGMFVGTTGYGTVTFSPDLVIQRFGSIISASVNAMVALLTVGTLAVLSAALLLRECARRKSVA